MTSTARTASLEVVVRLDRRGQSGSRRPTQVTWIAAVTCFWASPVLAEPSLRQECKDLAPEDSARVETRLLASLLTPEASEVSVSITCDKGIALVSASVGPEELRRSVALSGPVGPEAILALATRAVAQLLAAGGADGTAAATPADTSRSQFGIAHAASSAPATTIQTSSPSKVAPPMPDVATAARVHTLACTAGARPDSRLRTDIAVQSWGARAALGGVLGIEQTIESWSYAFLAGGARPLEQPSLSDVTEWTAAGELGWEMPGLLGMRISARLGLSVLTLSPESGITTTSGTLKSAGFLDLDISRPTWLGRFGLAPGFGVRSYSAKRAVAIDGQSELQLSAPSVHGVLTLLFRTNDR